MKTENGKVKGESGKVKTENGKVKTENGKVWRTECMFLHKKFIFC